MNGPLVDTHAHLDFPEFDHDREAVLARAWEAGVGSIITIGTDVERSRRAVVLAEGDPRIYAAVGIHPHEAAAMDEGLWAALEELARHPRVVAIGEVGLDYHYDRPPRDVQAAAFRRQVHLARAVGKPLIIHSREAHDDVVCILREEGAARIGGVMHCFSGDVRQAEDCLGLGFYISLAGPVTFKSGEVARRVAAAVPADRLLVETDCPFLSPHPYRGQRNEPARVALVAAEVARARRITEEEAAALTGENARRLFGLAACGAARAAAERCDVGALES